LVTASTEPTAAWIGSFCGPGRAPRDWPLQTLGLMPQVCTSLGQQMVESQFGALANGWPINGF